MAGVKGRSGGARPGAGAKKKPESEAQETMRELVRSVVTADDLRSVTAMALDMAKAGDDPARKWISAYCLGQPSNKIDIASGSGGVVIMLPEKRAAE